MQELDAILEVWSGNPDLAGVLATVVHVKGSAYRRPGARMLLLEDGRRVGSVSGGCLEGDLSRKAWWWTADGRPTIRVYDTTSDDDAVWEFGLGCNGVIQVLLERMESGRGQELFRFLLQSRSRREGGVVATVIAAETTFCAGDRLLVHPEGAEQGTVQGSELAGSLMPYVDRVMRSKTPCLARAGGAEVFLEWIGPAQRLVVFGAGHDAVPMARAASQLGWRVTVADGRPAYAKRDRFPEAERVVVIPVSASVAELHLSSEDAIVLMTHNFPQDVRLLRQILPLRPRYLGLLGPKTRTQRLMDELAGNAADFDLHSPVGLDLGGDTPEVTALSIVAEVQAALSNRQGGKLRLRHGAIHEPVVELGKAVPSISQTAVWAGPVICETAAGVSG